MGKNFRFLNEAAVRPTYVDQYGNKRRDDGKNQKMPSDETIKASRKKIEDDKAKEMIAARDALKTQTGKSSGKVQQQADGSWIAVSDDETQQPAQQMQTQKKQQQAQSQTKQSKSESQNGGEQVGTWSGDSYGEHITLTVGLNGNLSLKNDAGSNAGKWTAKGDGTYDVNIAGQSGQMNILNPSSATLTVGSDTIQLEKGTSKQPNQQSKSAQPEQQEQPESSEKLTPQQIDDEIKRLQAFFSTKSEQEETPVTEKKNIAHFLKFLSEKNYAKANKYLNNIIQNKTKKTILKEMK